MNGVSRRWRIGLAILLTGSPSAGFAQHVEPHASFVADILANPIGGQRHDATYTHQLVAGVELTPSATSPFSLTLSGAWTAGVSLSERAIGDSSGVQGTYNGGDGLWLYQFQVTHRTSHNELIVGRIAASDSFGVLDGFGAFVNGAFSSNGGAISINTLGRATSPSSSWGVTDTWHSDRLTLKLGAFLSDPNRFALAKHGLDFTMRPKDGVLGMVETVFAGPASLDFGLGAYHDTGRITRFDGASRRGSNGAYLWIERVRGDAPIGFFAMAQVAFKTDRSLFPFFAIAGLSSSARIFGRPEDTISIGVHSGRFGRASGKRGWESAVELNYDIPVIERVSIKPNLQYILNPSDSFPDALILGVQIQSHI